MEHTKCSQPLLIHVLTLPPGHLKLFIHLRRSAITTRHTLPIFPPFFSFNESVEFFIAKWFVLPQASDGNMQKSGRKKHFEMKRLKARRENYDINNN